MLDRARIYATDMDARRAGPGARGRVPAGQGAATTRATTSRPGGDGGVQPPTTRSPATGPSSTPTLLRDVVFAQHNLATDRSFNEFHLILCRNVLIYFGRDLQDRVLRLFDESLPRRGVLGARAARRRCAAPRSRTATSRSSKLRGSTGGGMTRLRADRHRRLLGRPARRRRDPRGPARATSGVTVLVVQHRAEDSDDLLAGLLDRRGPLPVREVEDKDAAARRGRAGRAGGLPRARRARPLRAVHRGARCASAGRRSTWRSRRAADALGAGADRRRADRRQRRRRRGPGRGPRAAAGSRSSRTRRPRAQPTMPRGGARGRVAAGRRRARRRSRRCSTGWPRGRAR